MMHFNIGVRDVVVLIVVVGAVLFFTAAWVYDKIRWYR